MYVTIHARRLSIAKVAGQQDRSEANIVQQLLECIRNDAEARATLSSALAPPDTGGASLGLSNTTTTGPQGYQGNVLAPPTSVLPPTGRHPQVYRQVQPDVTPSTPALKILG